jgi:hypothetical protein
MELSSREVERSAERSKGARAAGLKEGETAGVARCGRDAGRYERGSSAFEAKRLSTSSTASMSASV